MEKPQMTDNKLEQDEAQLAANYEAVSGRNFRLLYAEPKAMPGDRVEKGEVDTLLDLY